MEPENKSHKRHSLAHKKGGIAQVQGASFTSVVKETVGSMICKLKEGSIKGVLNVSKPIKISASQTFLEVYGQTQSNTQQMRSAVLTEDPVTRLKWICVYLLSGYFNNSQVHHSFLPLNPLLGETCTLKHTDGKSELFGEQSSHHPPISSVLIKSDKWSVESSEEVIASLAGITSIEFRRSGQCSIKIDARDKKSCVMVTHPANRGTLAVMSGEVRQRHAQKLVLNDIINKIGMEVTFGHSKGWGKFAKGALSSLGKSIFGGKKKKKKEDEIKEDDDSPDAEVSENSEEMADDVNIVIFSQVDNFEDESTRTLLCSGHGNQMEWIEFDDGIYWKMDEQEHLTHRFYPDADNLLASDSTLRADVIALKLKDLENGQKQKDDMENLQRDDRKMRALYAQKTKTTDDKI